MDVLSHIKKMLQNCCRKKPCLFVGVAKFISIYTAADIYYTLTWNAISYMNQNFTKHLFWLFHICNLTRRVHKVSCLSVAPCSIETVTDYDFIRTPGSLTMTLTCARGLLAHHNIDAWIHSEFPQGQNILQDRQLNLFVHTVSRHFAFAA